MRPAIKATWREAPNILIDTESERLVDMSYTLAADAYIGDVSSQAYEFLVHPRPMFFLDVFSRRARSREARYPIWSAGPVVQTVSELTPLLSRFIRREADYSMIQRRLFSETISFDTERTASECAADAILELLEQRGGAEQ